VSPGRHVIVVELCWAVRSDQWGDTRSRDGGPGQGCHGTMRRMSAGTDRGRGRAARGPRWWRVAVVLLVALVLLGGMVVVGRSIGVQPVTCTVVSAEPHASGGGRRSAPSASVYVTTQECGDVTITNGVTRENMAVRAAEVDRAETCTFEASWLDRTVKDWWGMTAQGEVVCASADDALVVG
jgi:hypothetical protein